MGFLPSDPKQARGGSGTARQHPACVGRSTERGFLQRLRRDHHESPMRVGGRQQGRRWPRRGASRAMFRAPGRGTSGARTRGERPRVAGAIPPGEAGSCAPARDRLHFVIRGKLASGEVPHNGIPRIWGGPGNGEKCDACQNVIRTGQLLGLVRYVPFSRSRASPGLMSRVIIHDDAAVIAPPPDPPAA